MPKLLSRSKHEEFESNSAFQIRNQEERIEENRGNWSTCKIGSCEHCASCALCIMRTVPPASCSPAFHASVFLLHFLFLPILTLVIAFVLFFFVTSLTLSTYISLSMYKLAINSTQIKSAIEKQGRQFPRSFLIFPFSFLFLGCQTLL